MLTVFKPLFCFVHLKFCPLWSRRWQCQRAICVRRRVICAGLRVICTGQRVICTGEILFWLYIWVVNGWWKRSSSVPKITKPWNIPPKGKNRKNKPPKYSETRIMATGVNNTSCKLFDLKAYYPNYNIVHIWSKKII